MSKLNLDQLIEFVDVYVTNEEIGNQLIDALRCGENLRDCLVDLSSSSWACDVIDDWDAAVGNTVDDE